MQKADRQIVLFAATVCITCSLLLSGAAALLQSRQAYNVELDRKTNVLKAFGVEVAGISAEEVERYFTDYISEVVIKPETGEILQNVTSSDLTSDDKKLKTRLPLYRWTEDGVVKKYALPISGYGLWSTIYGYLAVQSDLSTIVGVTFYDHGETPGLGGEISQPWFQTQFRGKEVRNERGELVPFQVVKGGVANKYPDGNVHAVDGITAATITANGVQKFINQDLARFEPYFNKVRGT
jgi:Na+-transporting NADH:ubiquinone oxidoreductase subunit C